MLDLGHFISFSLKRRHDEDMVDKLNNKLTAYVFFAVGLSILAQEYGGNPLECMAKPNWVNSWLEYAQDYCFVEGTYYVPIDEKLPPAENMIHRRKIAYYQWIPFFFYLMGIILQIPRLLWSAVNSSSHLHLTAFCNAAVENFRQNAIFKEHELGAYINHFEDFIGKRTRLLKADGRKGCCGFIKAIFRFWYNYKSSRYLFNAYVFIKFLNIINIVIVMVILCIFVSDRSDAPFGVSQIQSLVKGEDWSRTAMFPRVTICQFHVREKGIQQETIISRKVLQCVLKTNMFIEKIFFVIWFWLIFLFCINVLNFFLWMWRLYPKNVEKFLSQKVHDGVQFVNFFKPEHLRLEKKPVEDDDTEGEDHPHDKEDADADPTEVVVEKPGATPAAKKPKKSKGMSNEEKEIHKAQEKKKYLDAARNYIKEFSNDLGHDGILTLRLISANAGGIIVSQIVSQIFYDRLKDGEARVILKDKKKEEEPDPHISCKD